MLNGRFQTKHDLTGQRFGKLTAKAAVGNGDWNCQCDCGAERKRSAYALRNGSAISCGCDRVDQKTSRENRFGSSVEEKNLISHQELLRVLDYNEQTGIFTWLESTARLVKVGDAAGSTNKRTGYTSIKIGWKRYPAHHLAWFYVHGSWPVEQIDHINRTRSDNRIMNLREATNSQNQQNRAIESSCKSGLRGICKRGNRWTAEIMANKKRIYLGSFQTPEEAGSAYLKAKRDLHPFYVDCEGGSND